ncbi:hypothetical protein AAE478_008931 [Parahypoxylon ruwenzoriense]
MASQSGTTSDINTQASASAPAPGITTSRTTRDGSVATSSDPRAAPTASTAQKLRGDASGAVSGTLGSVQAAAGAALRNAGLEDKGRARMREEDERLGAKRGVMPVGSGRRMEKGEGEGVE